MTHPRRTPNMASMMSALTCTRAASRACRFLVLIPVLAFAASCGRSDSASGDSAKGTAGAPPANAVGDTMHVITMNAAEVQHGGIRWSAAETHDAAAVIEAPGQLIPNEDRTARIGAPLQARVMAVHVQAGARVGRGQALLTLQSPEASAARAELAKADADLSARIASSVYARSARERAERLLAAKAAPRQDVERAQADDALAESELARARAEIARSRSTLAALGVSGADGAVVIRSPLDGTVLSREASPGMVVSPGMPLITVSDASSLWLDVSVPAAAASGLANGSRVRFGVAAFPADTFDARVVSVGGALDPQTRALPVRAAVTSTRNRLRSAMFATVWLDAGARTQSVAVPTRSIMLLDGRPVLFIATPLPGGAVRLERRDIDGGGDQGGTTRVVRGVKPGELVVTDGAFAVKATFSRSKMAAG